MVAGLIDHETGTRDITRLGGLRSAMPLTFVAALLAGLSMGGIPPFFGFLAKEEIYAALGFGSFWLTGLTLVAIVGNALMMAIGLAVALKPFLGDERKTPKPAHEGPPLLWLGPMVLALLGVIAALFAGATHYLFSSPMASAVAGSAIDVHINLIPHFGLPLVLSIMTIAAGYLAYRELDRARFVFVLVLQVIGWGPDRGFDQVMRGILRFSWFTTGLIQTGRLAGYLSITFLVVALTLFLPMIIFGELPAWPDLPQMLFYEWAVILIAVAGLGAVVFAKNRLTAIVSLGIQGFAVALLFMLFGAPDLSFTQFMVETLSVVILALAMMRLRLSLADQRPRLQSASDAAPVRIVWTGLHADVAQGDAAAV